MHEKMIVKYIHIDSDNTGFYKNDRIWNLHACVHKRIITFCTLNVFHCSQTVRTSTNFFEIH